MNMAKYPAIAPDNRFRYRPVKPAPLLAELRDRVFKQSENRSPKWKFRLAPDLVVEIQPKLTTSLLKFECHALQCEGADAAKLTAKGTNQKEAIRGNYWRLTFDLVSTVPGEWYLKPKCYGYARGIDAGPAYQLPERIVAAFEVGHFDRLRPEIMLGHHCMICGKGLTDPVSMARFIGPECAGTSSPSLPFMIRLNAQNKTEEVAS